MFDCFPERMNKVVIFQDIVNTSDLMGWIGLERVSCTEAGGGKCSNVAWYVRVSQQLNLVFVFYLYSNELYLFSRYNYFPKFHVFKRWSWAKIVLSKI